MKLVLLLFSLLLLADSNVQGSEFAFRVRRATATVHLEMGGSQFVERLRIKFSDPIIPDQIINCLEAGIELAPALHDPGFSSGDYDRDGYIDFSFRDASGTAANHICHFYFYRPSTRRFERRRDFDDSGVSDYDPRTGLFSGYWRNSASSSFGFVYRFEKGRLLLVRTVQHDYSQHFRDILPNVPEYSEYLITTLYASDGRILRRFYRYVGPP